jgi:hypothetical protein
MFISNISAVDLIGIAAKKVRENPTSLVKENKYLMMEAYL